MRRNRVETNGENMQDKNNPTNRPTGRLNPLSDDIKELFLQALKRAGWPRENVQALRNHGDPRPRVRLADGTEVAVEYVHPLPPRSMVEAAFFEIVAEAVGEPPGIRRSATVRREIGQTYGKLAHAVLGSMMWPGDETHARDKLASALTDPPDPGEGATWRRWARRAWEGVRGSIAMPLYRAVLGADARREEDRPPNAVERDPDTDELRPVVVEDPLAGLASLAAAAREAERAAEQVEALRSVATKRELVYLDELDRLLEEGEPVESARIEAGKPLGLDAKAARQLRHRLRRRYEAKMAS